jgi:hypothetical protein
MGAISFIYNLSPKSLTLNEQEKQKSGGELFGQSTKDEIKQFTNQVSGFFSSLVREVKSTADELMNNVSSPTTPENIFGTQSQPTSPVRQQFSQMSVQERERIQQEREQYELDLAIAISLSEQQNQESMLDIDAYTPMTTAPRRQSIDEPDVELQRSK